MNKFKSWFKRNKRDIICLSIAYLVNFIGIYILFSYCFG
jgi:hypothetical protein